METNTSNNVSRIRFVGVQVPFYSQYNCIKPLDIDGYVGVIAKSVMAKFNWSYEGKALESLGEVNGTGIIGCLTRNESDIGFYPRNLDSDDFRYVDYAPVTLSTNAIVVSSDGSANFESTDFAFVTIYSSWAWLSWLASFVLVVVFSSLAENLSRTSSGPKAGLARNIFNSYRITLNQGEDLPLSTSGHLRLAAAGWILGCFVLNAGFAGGLLSKLTLPPEPSYIETFGDITNHPNIRVQIVKNVNPAIRTLKASRDNVRSKIWQRILRFNSAVDFRDWDVERSVLHIIKGNMIAILEEGLVFQVFPMMLDRDLMKRLHLPKEGVLNTQWVMPIRKYLEPEKKELFKRTLQSLIEGDIIERDIKFDQWTYKECFIPDPIPPKKLKLSSIRVVCLGLLLGYLISVVVLVFEFKGHSRMVTTRKNRKTITI